jgi:hypothetical protein
MARDPGSGPSASLAPARAWWWGGWVFAFAFGSTWACATGIDVSSAELAEICSGQEQLVICEGGVAGGNSGAGGTGPLGGAGAGSNPAGNSGSSGSFSGTGGSTGSSGSSGSTGTSGSSGASGSTGSSGAAGSGNQPQQPLAQGQCMPAGEDDVVIVYTDRADAVMFNQATMVLQVENNGASFDLSDLTMRYWFTDDGLSDFTGDIDYASPGGGQDIKSNVTVTFGEENGSNYAAIGFTTTGVTVGPEGVDTVQLRIHTSGYQMLDQSNDFSFSANADEIQNRNITPYINGVQVGGCIPMP